MDKQNYKPRIIDRQAEKRHFADPSLACALLKATPAGLLGDLETFGFLFEALCERDLRIYAGSFGAHLYHYQDYRNQEIDAVIELPDGQWCAFEIKLGANQIDAAACQRPDGVFVVPVTALRRVIVIPRLLNMILQSALRGT